jgi:hypothetical protein
MIKPRVPHPPKLQTQLSNSDENAYKINLVTMNMSNWFLISVFNRSKAPDNGS